MLSRRLAIQPGSRFAACGLDDAGRWCRGDVEGEVIVFRTDAPARRSATPARDGAIDPPAAPTVWSWASAVWRVGPPPLPLHANVTGPGPDPVITVATDRIGHPERYSAPLVFFRPPPRPLVFYFFQA